MENYSFWPKLWHFLAQTKGDLKPCIGWIWWKIITLDWIKKICFDTLKNCILGHWTFLFKMNFLKKCLFLPEKCIFLKKWQYDPQHRTAPRPSQWTIFLEGNFTPIFEAKKLGTFGQSCPGHFSSLQFSPKSAIFGGFEKKIQKESTWHLRHILYVTQIHYYTWF